MNGKDRRCGLTLSVDAGVIGAEGTPGRAFDLPERIRTRAFFSKSRTW